MKKFICIALAAALAFAVSSCGKRDESLTQTETASQAEETIEETTENTTEAATQETTTQATAQTIETKPQTTKAPSTAARTTAPPVSAAQTATQTTTRKQAQTPKQSSLSGFENEMLNQVNAARAENGAGTLSLNGELCENAQTRAEEISRDNCFSHTRPDGTGCFTAVTVDYMTAGENIAAGQKNVSSVMEDWMNSSGHRANILNADFTQAGFGCFEKGGKKYWVQIFAG